jgi:C4-type Zn-finger protein
MSDRELKCPKDGNPLVVVYESEKIGDTTRVSIYYKCQVCGFRRDIERLEISRGEQGLVVKKFLYSSS